MARATPPSKTAGATPLRSGTPSPTPAIAPARTAKQSTAPTRLTGELRQQMIAEAAYYRALQRGFDGGDPNEDWLAAEREIDQRFSTSH